MLARHKGEVPFFTYLLPFFAGICLALSLPPQPHLSVLIFAFSILLVVFITLNLAFAKWEIYLQPWIGGIIMHALFLLLGVVVTLRYDERIKPHYFETQKADALLVRVDNAPQFKNGYLRFTGEVIETALVGKRQEATGNILITLPADSAFVQKFAYGDVLLIPNKAASVNPPFNPGEFNYKRYLAHQNVYAQAFLNPGDAIVLGHNTGNSVTTYALQLRQKLVLRFQQNMKNAEAVAVASTLILGYKAALGDDVIEAYSHTGTIHILSVSGGHVIILFTLLGWVLNFMDGWLYGRFLKAALIVLCIVYYALLTGLSPAATRAAVMVAMLIIGKAFYRKAHTLNILAAAAFFQLLFNSYLLADVGFQLSYLAVAGLVVFQPVIYRRLEFDNRLADWLWKFFSASIAAQAITFPLAAYYFHQFPAYFLLSNLFILPLAEIIMYLGLGLLIIAQAGAATIAKWLGGLLEFFINVMDGGLRYIERWPYAYLDKIWITSFECLLLSLVVVLIFAWLYYRKVKLLGWAMITLLSFSGIFNAHVVDKMQKNNVTFLNLKKHTGLIFKHADSAVLITDLADTDKAYRYSIKPGLDSNGVRSVIKCGVNGNVATPWLHKKGNLMRFAGGNILIVDTIMPKPRYAVPAAYLYLAQSNFKNALPFLNVGAYKTVVVGAGITPRNTQAIKDYADSVHKKIFLLRSNYSLVFKSD